MNSRDQPIAKVVFDSLSGEWSFVREISGAANMSGKARIQRQSESSLNYSEKGNLILADQTLMGSFRRYQYQIKDHKIFILYDDPHRNGELMHELKFDESGNAMHEHVCGHDKYLIDFKFLSKDLFETYYTIKGPRKNQQIKTVFTRL